MRKQLPLLFISLLLVLACRPAHHREPVYSRIYLDQKDQQWVRSYDLILHQFIWWHLIMTPATTTASSTYYVTTWQRSTTPPDDEKKLDDTGTVLVLTPSGVPDDDGTFKEEELDPSDVIVDEETVSVPAGEFTVEEGDTTQDSSASDESTSDTGGGDSSSSGDSGSGDSGSSGGDGGGDGGSSN